MKAQRVIVLVAAGLFVSAGASAQTPATLEACVALGSGIVKIVGANQPCGANQTRVTWNIAGPQGPAGPGGPSLAVVDSSTPSALEVGYLVDVNRVVLTAATDTQWFALTFDSAGFTNAGFSFPTIFYEASGCTGSGYLSATSSGKPVVEGSVSQGEVFYANDPLSGNLTAGSMLRNQQCTNLSVPFNSIGLVAPVLSRPLSDFLIRPDGTLTPPFRIVRQ